MRNLVYTSPCDKGWEVLRWDNHKTVAWCRTRTQARRVAQWINDGLMRP
jgi:hypothetical protein